MEQFSFLFLFESLLWYPRVKKGKKSLPKGNDFSNLSCFFFVEIAVDETKIRWIRPRSPVVAISAISDENKVPESCYTHDLKWCLVRVRSGFCVLLSSDWHWFNLTFHPSSIKTEKSEFFGLLTDDKFIVYDFES